MEVAGIEPASASGSPGLLLIPAFWARFINGTNPVAPIRFVSWKVTDAIRKMRESTPYGVPSLVRR